MSKLIDDINKFKNIQKLKQTYRFSGRLICGEKESTADHSWCCLVVADYLLNILEQKAPLKYKLDKLKIHEMIIYHDMLEAYTGDVDNDPSDSEAQKTKAQIEEESLPLFMGSLPKEIQHIYTPRIREYEQRETLESKFVKIVDKVETEFQCFFQKDLYKNWTREFFIGSKKKGYDDFPELYFLYEEVLAYYDENGYFKD